MADAPHSWPGLILDKSSDYSAGIAELVALPVESITSDNSSCYSLSWLNRVDTHARLIRRPARVDGRAAFDRHELLATELAPQL